MVYGGYQLWFMVIKKVSGVFLNQQTFRLVVSAPPNVNRFACFVSLDFPQNCAMTCQPASLIIMARRGGTARIIDGYKAGCLCGKLSSSVLATGNIKRQNCIDVFIYTCSMCIYYI